MYGNAARAYQTQHVQGASKVKQVAMLYDKAIASLREAVQAIEDREIERRWKANRRAQDIILALYTALDQDNGGEVAGNLARLYSFALRRLPQVDIKNDPAPAHEVVEVLEPLSRSWHELARRELKGPLVDGEAPAEPDAAGENPDRGGSPDPSGAPAGGLRLTG